MSDEQRAAVMLPNNQRLIRRAAIRRILAGRYGRNGIKSYAEMQTELWDRFRIRVGQTTLAADMRAMGAFKAQDPSAPSIEWWGLAPFNPGLEDARAQLDPEIIEREVAYKVAGHVVDVVPVGRMVYVNTETRAGLMVAYWLALLSWPEILMVQEGIESVVLHCLTPHAAVVVAERLVGYRIDDEEGSDEEGDDTPESA